MTLSFITFIEIGLVIFFVMVAWPDFRVNALKKFRQDPPFLHVTVLIIGLIFALWQMNAGLRNGLAIHFLGLTTLSLMYGWRVAYLLTLPIFVALWWTGDLTLNQVPGAILLSGLFPIGLSYAIFALSYHKLPKHLFVFIFVAGFFNAALTGSLHILAKGFYEYALGIHDWYLLAHQYFSLIPLLAFPEGLLNGMALTLLCVLKPDWLRCFSDHDYLYHAPRK
ncbi:hypothetical protein HGP28_00325 [Vibrio sp. SM6]|uniref:Energy-coupling factor ABC transporter permease n=1 Tax=Vibrio agarilyticus TaxID=2726741 RepID=A0A7X8TMJ3_9VIBR|nr:energy-coupling factor ABC transporter permease [Vibrio agarilyticus]NLS11329.1 hypothetical protein [Vibrio agarilyticus]